MTILNNPTGFDILFDRLIGHEGGLSMDKADPGNWTGGRPYIGKLKGTKYGIASNTYPDLDIPNLTLDQAKEICYRDWYLKVGAEQLPFAVTAQVWDFAINAGMGTAKRALQYAAGVAEDGKIGPITINAVKQADLNDLLLRFNARRLKFYTSLSTWSTYGKGWTNRVATNLEYAAKDNDA